MASSKNKKKQKEPKNAKQKSNVFKSEKFKVLLSFFIIGFSVFYIISIISYFFTWKEDNALWIDVISSPDIVVSNINGKLGAYIAYLFVHQFFGISSILLFFFFLSLGLIILIPKIRTITKYYSILILSTIWLSLFLGFIDNILENNLFLLGGEYGYFISKWFIAFAGTVGTLFFMTLFLFSLVMYSTPVLYEKIKNKIWHNFKNDNKDLNKDEAIENESLNEIEEKNFENEEKLEIIDKPENTEILEEPISEQDREDIKEEVSLSPKETVTINPNEEHEQVKKDEELSSDEMLVERIEEEIATDINDSPTGDFDPTLELSHYEMPSPELLEEHDFGGGQVTKEELEENKNKIVKTLEDYKIKIKSIKATIGPTITLYEIVPAAGVRINKIKNLEDDIALSLAALGIRIIAPMPGKGTVGIEVPNTNPEVVPMKKVVLSKAFQESKYELPVVLGKTISNESYVFDLAKTPHMLVAGATGQGKSVGINAILTSLLYKKHPSQLKFVLVDPKQVELSIYSKIEKHYLAKLPDEEEPIITDVKKVVRTLNSLTVEMDDRYKILKKAEARNIIEYNNKFVKRQLNPENGHRFLPYIVLVIDEFADLIMTAGKEVETPIARIAQLARAVGIHMIIATQRPSTNIITGIIKANFPTRIAFRVTSMIDSRTILDSPGANQLIGRGDLLISQGGGDLIRVQCAFVDTPEVDRITKHIASQQSYASAFMLPEVEDPDSDGSITDVDLNKRDSLFEEAARLVVATQQGSTSSIQRKFSIGYNRAGRIMDQLEAAGIVGPFEGSKARKVLYPDEYSLEQYLNTLK